MNLDEVFGSIKDPRRGQGLRISLPPMLWMSFLGICCGYTGYREIATFAESNAQFFTEAFGLKHGVPSHVTFWQVLTSLKKTEVEAKFNEWLQQQDLSVYDWLSGDGKSLKSTLRHGTDENQDFCAVVSFYVQKTGLTYLIADYRNKKIGEAEIVRDLLSSLKDKGLILTLDALHCSKKQ